MSYRNFHVFFLGVGSAFFVFRVGIYAVKSVSWHIHYYSSAYSFHILVLDARDLSNVNLIYTGGIEVKENLKKFKIKKLETNSDSDPMGTIVMVGEAW
jgi:hypothetical protein